MIKFKKMSTLAKVGSIAIVTSITGVAFIPVINKFIDNPKTKVHVYEFNNRLFKTKAAAEDARKKFTAMSGLIEVMNSDKALDPNTDYKPLMAEFVSFVSKMFAIKIFKMDDDSTKVNHFQYDGLSKEQKQKLLEQQISGEIKYGDLTDMTSMVKFANAHKQGNEWMFTPVDEMLLALLGDGSEQVYSFKELKFVEINKKIESLKATYEAYYQKYMKGDTSFNNIPYTAVHGLIRHNDEKLTMADHAETNDEGDYSGNEYTKDFVDQYLKWGTLKSKFEAAKTDYDGFVTTQNISPAMKPVLEKMVASQAVKGWNNKERYSKDEIELRDLLAKVTSQKIMLDADVIPGNHEDTNVNIVEGWNWKPTGDGSDTEYKQWQLDLAKNIQLREKLINLHLTQAPEGATEGMNFAKIGDGTGRFYSQSVFELKRNFEDTSAKIQLLNDQIKFAIASGTQAAPTNGVVSDTGKHIDPVGLGDGKDYSDSWTKHEALLKLEDALQQAKLAKDALDSKISSTTINTNINIGGSDENEATLLAILNFDIIKQGWNWNKNYNEDQVNYKIALDKVEELKQKIKDLEEKKDADGKTIIAAPEGAIAHNLVARGAADNKIYTQDQIDLRDYRAQIGSLGIVISAAQKNGIISAPDGAVPNPIDPTKHVKLVGLANGEYYSQDFIETAQKYRSYLGTLDQIQKDIDALKDKYPGLVSKDGVSFENLHKNSAVEGVNAKEVFSTDEITYSKDLESMKTLQSVLKDADDALEIFKSAVSNDKAEYLAKLQSDAKDGTQPKEGLNQKPAGDETGKSYSSDDKAFTDNLQLLKDNFPHGNPWWTRTDLKKDSDEAYFALYNDWKKAVEDGTKAVNTEKVGDGTNHQFDDANFKTFDAFFRKMVIDLHSGGARATKVSSEVDTILEYLVKHGSFDSSAYGVGVNEDSSKAVDSISDIATGDESGHTYLKVDDVHYWWWKAYGDNGLQSKWKAADVVYQKHIADAKTFDASPFQDAIDAAQVKIDAYNTEVNRLKQIVTEDNNNESKDSKLYDRYKSAASDMLGSHKPLHGLQEDDINKMAMLLDVDNMAGTMSADQKTQNQKIKDLDDDIKTATSTLKSNQEILNNIKVDDRVMFLLYSKLQEPFIIGKNWAASGDGSGNTYTSKQISLRDQIKSLKEELSKHTISISLDEEFTRIMKLQQNSEEGLNSKGSSGKSVGDTTGTTWAQWEVDLYPSVSSINDLNSEVGTDGPAPEKAISGINHQKTGDGSGDTRTSDSDKELINVFIPKYEAALKAVSDAQDSLDDLKDEKNKLGLASTNANFSLDKTKYFVTKAGKVYDLDKVLQARLWKVQADLRDKYQTEKNDWHSKAGKAQKAVGKYVDDNKDDLKTWNKNKSNALQSIDIYSDEKLADEKKSVDEKKKDFDKYDDKIKDWWNKNKGHHLDIADNDRNFNDYIVSSNYDTFVSTTDKTTKGTLYSLYKVLRDYRRDDQNKLVKGVDGHYLRSNVNGELNVKASSRHTKEEFALRDAMLDIMELPTGSNPVTDMRYYAYAFNTLINIYQYSIDHKTYVEPKDSFDPLHFNEAPSNDKPSYSDKSHFEGRLHKSVELGAHSEASKVAFKQWLMQYLSADTEKVNIPEQGNGKNENFKTEFFSARVNGKNIDIDSVDVLDRTTLGKAAINISIFHSSAKIMGEDSVLGPNYIGDGDLSGHTYSHEDIQYFEGYKRAESALEDVNKLQDKIDKESIGKILQIAPHGQLDVGSTTHTDPLGDGTGNEYTKELIDDVKKYFTSVNQLKDQQDLLDGLKSEWNAKVLDSKRSWDEVTKISEIAKTGLNHPTWWSAEEIKYQGDNIKNKDLLGKIAALEAKMVSDPNAKPGSSATSPIHVIAAPNGAVEGFNNEATGDATGDEYNAEQIDKRDKLKILNKDLVDEEAIVQEFIKKNTIPAPRADIVPVKMENWHDQTIGDGSDKYYSQKLFDDRDSQKAAADKVASTTKALTDFVAKVGQDALTQIETEVGQGMVDGVNTEEKYSIAEIALRDNKVKLSQEQTQLSLIEGDENYKIYVSLKDDSIVGENTAKVGLGNNQEYTEEEIDLRDLTNLIQDQEKINGITSEQEVVSYTDLFTNKAVDTGFTVKEYYNHLDLGKAKVGENHKAHGDQSDALYTSSDINTFNDIVALQNDLAKNEDRVKELKGNNVKPAPLGERVIDATDTSDSSLWDKHKEAVGDASGETYSIEQIAQAYKYVSLLKDLENAQQAFDAFITSNSKNVEFYKYKLSIDSNWNPKVGINWTKKQFEYKQYDMDKNNLGIGRTLIDSNPEQESKLGTNRGALSVGKNKDEMLVLYKEKDGQKIHDEILGSDQVRIGYALKINGEVTGESPVLGSLKSVARYLQNHEELAPQGLMDKFALLKNMNVSDTNDIYKIKDELVSKDRFNSMAENYKWGDE